MVTVCNVSALDLLELLLEEVVLGGVNLPKFVDDWHIRLVLVLLHHAVRLAHLRQVRNLLLDCRVFSRAICQEHRSDVGALYISELGPVFLLLLERLLVLLDEVVLVVGD